MIRISYGLAATFMACAVALVSTWSAEARAEDAACAAGRAGAQAALDRAAASAADGRPSAYEAAANAYIDLWQRMGVTPMSEGRPPACDALDAVLSRAAEAYESAGLPTKAIAARMVILNPQYRFDASSDLARQATAAIARSYQSLAIFDQAANWSERLASQWPARPTSGDALADAFTLRLGLDDVDRAREDLDSFRRAYRATRVDDLAGLTVALARRYVEEERWEEALAMLEGGMRAIDASHRFDAMVQAHYLLGTARAQVVPGTAPKGPTANEALVEMRQVGALWANPADALVKTKRGLAPGVVEAGVRDTIDAVAGAIFFLAEEKRRTTVDALLPAAPTRTASPAEIRAQIAAKVAPWARQRMLAIQAAIPGYEKVLTLDPPPSAFWTIAAKGRIALMWADFVDAFRAPPVPPIWNASPAVRGAWYDGVDALAEPIKVAHAKPATTACLEASRRLGTFSAFTRDCEVWLARNYKAEFHVLDELRPNGMLDGGARDDQPRPTEPGVAFPRWGY
jgi:tetratricopeptide (TPR) repeat protein